MKMVVIILLGLANSQDSVKLEEQDLSYQHLSCTSPVSRFRIVSWLRKDIKKIDKKIKKTSNY